MFLEEPPPSEASEAAYAGDREKEGFVWTITKLWAWNPQADRMFAELLGRVAEDGGPEYRDKAILVTSTAPAIGNSACSLAWGNRLAKTVDVDTAVRALRGEESEAMSERHRALARWARRVATDPGATTQSDVAELRRLGLSDAEIFNVTLYIALRIAFSTVNDALDAPLDRQATESYPEQVVEAVDFGRPSA